VNALGSDAKQGSGIYIRAGFVAEIEVLETRLSIEVSLIRVRF
jgi:hypothetical protein